MEPEITIEVHCNPTADFFDTLLETDEQWIDRIETQINPE